MGSASGEISEESAKKCFRLGEEIALNDCILITGGCPGLPYEAIKGAKNKGGLTVGISPGLSIYEHVYKYHCPLDGHDILIYTGSGLMGREITNIRSCDIVVIVGGRSGTLGEFSIAYDEGRLIGILEGTGGIADHAKEILNIIDKKTCSQVVYSDDPKELIGSLLRIYDSPEYHASILSWKPAP